MNSMLEVGTAQPREGYVMNMLDMDRAKQVLAELIRAADDEFAAREQVLSTLKTELMAAWHAAQ